MPHLRWRSGIAALVLLSLLTIANPAVAADPNEGFFDWPTAGRITQPYGCTGFSSEPRYGSCRHFHGGIDIANSRGTPIRAAASGVVTHVGWDPWGTRNWMVMLNHGAGLKTWYAHMRGRHIDGIRPGNTVQQGQVIGYMDTTGFSTGPHLHWAALRNGSYINPRIFLTRSPGGPTERGSTYNPIEPTNPIEITLSCGLESMPLSSGDVVAMPLEGDEPTTCMA